MPRYTVELIEEIIYSIDVDARSEEEAKKKACAEWSASEDPEADYFCEGLGVTVAGVTEL
jgi:hypothetical protein